MPSAKIRFLLLSDLSLSLLFKLLHEKVYHPLAVPHTQSAAGMQPVKLQPITTSRNNCCSCYHKNPVQLLGWAQSQPLQQITQAKEILVFGATDEEITEGWKHPNTSEELFSSCGDLIVILLKNVLLTSGLISLKYFWLIHLEGLLTCTPPLSLGFNTLSAVEN